MRNLKDKWVVITGAARGLGRALALEFATYGSNIIIADVDRENMEKTASDIEAKGRKVFSFYVDMGDMAQVRKLAKEAIEKAGQVDVLVNNAGIFFGASMVDTSWEEWQQMLNINLHGPILLTKELAPQMMKRGSGHLVNISSLAGLMGGGAYSTYSVTKFGLVGFSQSIRIELGHKGVGVTVVCPGFIRTSIIEHCYYKNLKDCTFEKWPWLISMSPERAARKIVKAVRKNKRRIILTLFAKFMYSMSYWMPFLTEWMGRKIYVAIKIEE